MLELGDFAAEGHRKVGRAVAQNQIAYLIAVGSHAAEIVEGAIEEGMNTQNCLAFENQDEIKKVLSEWAEKGKTVLVKGSRGAQMEKVTEYLKSLF